MENPTYETEAPPDGLARQLEQLEELVDLAFVKTAKEVKGSFTSGDYVTWKLNRIFTPACWSFTILRGPDMIALNDHAAYAQVIGRLEVTFANGAQSHQDDIGIWPLTATGARNGGTLDDTAPERYETVCKAARTDCLKNATYNLGNCFAPLSDGALVGYLQREGTRKRLPPSNKSGKESADELFGIAREREGGDTKLVAPNNQSSPLTEKGAVKVWLEAQRLKMVLRTDLDRSTLTAELTQKLGELGFSDPRAVLTAAWGKERFTTQEIAATLELAKRHNAKTEIDLLL